MAQDLSTYEGFDQDDAAQKLRGRVDRSTAQAVAAAVAALAVATLVVGASTHALVTEGTGNSLDLQSGTIMLVDDDEGHSLVDLGNMAPGRPVTECINIAYTGSVLPVALTMVADTEGDIAEFIEIDVETGSNGGFGSCDGFQSDDTIFNGRLDALDEEGLDLGEIRSDNEKISFRFTFDLADTAEAAGRSGTASFVWEAVPS